MHIWVVWVQLRSLRKFQDWKVIPLEHANKNTNSTWKEILSGTLKLLWYYLERIDGDRHPRELLHHGPFTYGTPPMCRSGDSSPTFTNVKLMVWGMFQVLSRWWFEIFVDFHPQNWGNDPISLRSHIFQMGWGVQPPTLVIFLVRSFRKKTVVICRLSCTHGIHVWYIFLHWVDFCGKCR